ncbi:general substrate transporter [Myriangium duriaei CBS 260.36]|uniref:General substrate transporter n=1 Tax=Myriangium duriaei CBS 260.36 TaxID=1168546 RepID=A0A9P4MI12_9PEZI|nr:general substrate transporter [Myriangium duriaei CBS 260.36]
MLNAVRSVIPSRPPGYVLATVAVSLAGFLNGFDTGSVGAVMEMPHFGKTFGTFSPFIHGLTVSMIMLTGAFPSLYAGQLGDILGRLKTIQVGALLFVVGAIMQATAHQLPVFIAGRAIGGIGMGTWMSPLAVYVTEIAPSARRGMLMATPQLAVTFGIRCGYFTCYGTVRIDSPLSWKSIYIMQSVAGVALAAACMVIPESPRWALLQGDRESAIHLLERLDFSRAEAEKDFLGPAAQRQITAQPGPIQGLVMIFRKPYRSRTTLALVMLGMIQLSGIDGVLYYAPILFSQAGLPVTTASFVASGLSAILMFAITIPTLIFVDRFNRRSVTIVGGVLLTFCMFTIGLLYATNAVHPTGIARFVVVALVFIFGLTYCATWGVVGKIYASEIQPAATRSAANCVAQGLGFLTNWLVAILTPILLARSSYSAYFLFGGFCVVSVVGLWCYMPETRGQSLEAIEEAFKAPLAGGSRIGRLAKKWAGLRKRVNGGGSSRNSIAGEESPTGGGAVSGADTPVELVDMLAAGPEGQSVTTASGLETTMAAVATATV